MDPTSPVTASPSGEGKRGAPSSRLDALVLLPNLALVAITVLYLVALQPGRSRVAPLVEGTPATRARIAALELNLERDPSNMGSALELARLYQNVGEFPWSYHALLNADKHGGDDPAWRLMLGLAFLELGKNDDAVRVLDRAREHCKQTCSSNTHIKLDLFMRIAHIFREQGIDGRKQHAAAEKAVQQVLKSVQVRPEQMRSKAPASPSPAAPARSGG